MKKETADWIKGEIPWWLVIGIVFLMSYNHMLGG